MRSMFIALALLFVAPAIVSASGVEVSPILIDENLEKRSVVTKEITLTNQTDSVQVIYATVNEVSVDDAGAMKEFVAPAVDDRTTAITSWLEISRGRILLEPGKSTTTPLTIRVHPKAEAGEYHAFVGFVPASNRPEAEKIAMAGGAKGTIVKIQIDEKQNHAFAINSFLVDRFVLKNEDRVVTVQVKNDGDGDMVPSGEIIFYNSRGEEVSAAPVNQQSEHVAPGEVKDFLVSIPFTDKVGRFKANVRLGDGVAQQALVFDTTQFFMIPMKWAIVAGIVILLLSLIVTYLLHHSFRDDARESEYGDSLPLYVRNDREHQEKEHDIDLKK